MPTVTLTFDNGPTPEATPGVLDVLARRGLRATFFVVGRMLAAPGARALAERAREEGHWIGNHTWSHAVPLGEDPVPDAPAREIAATEALIGDLAHPDRLFRPFGRGGRIGPHLLSPAVRDHLLAGGYTCVLWSSIPRDWDDPDGWVARALSDCTGAAESVVVLHDLPSGAMRHLDRFLGTLLDAGTGFAQAFPPTVLPIRRGRASRPLDDIVAAP